MKIAPISQQNFNGGKLIKYTRGVKHEVDTDKVTNIREGKDSNNDKYIVVRESFPDRPRGASSRFLNYIEFYNKDLNTVLTAYDIAKRHNIDVYVD